MTTFTHVLGRLHQEKQLLPHHCKSFKTLTLPLQRTVSVSLPFQAQSPSLLPTCHAYCPHQLVSHPVTNKMHKKIVSPGKCQKKYLDQLLKQKVQKRRSFYPKKFLSRKHRGTMSKLSQMFSSTYFKLNQITESVTIFMVRNEKKQQ